MAQYPDHDSDVLDATQTVEKIEITEPPMYKVWLLNDDFTPMEFVIEVLEVVFKKSRPAAVQIMMQVHRQQKGMIAIYPKDIANKKAEKVHDMAKEAGHPLRVSVEKDSPSPA